MLAVSVYGVNSASEVRRASTVISQTPGVGFDVVREFGPPPGHEPPGTAGE